MTVIPKLKIEAATTTADAAPIGGHVIRVFGVPRCPCCLIRLHATAMRDVGDGEYRQREGTTARCVSGG